MSGRVLYAYTPYGEALPLGPDEGNAIQYTGRENDGTGLYYYRARYYDPVLKQWISEDPIGLAGGLNVYSYVNGNPVSFTDPSGLANVDPNATLGGGSGGPLNQTIYPPPAQTPSSVNLECLARCQVTKSAICAPFTAGAAGLSSLVGGIAGIPGGPVSVWSGAEIGASVGSVAGYAVCRATIVDYSCLDQCKKDPQQCPTR